jgi:hypothetical protein
VELKLRLFLLNFYIIVFCLDKIKRGGNSNVFIRYFKNIFTEYHITTADHTLGSFIVKVIPVSSCCWSQIDTLCDSKSELLNFAMLYLKAFASESAKDTHVGFAPLQRSIGVMPSTVFVDA